MPTGKGFDNIKSHRGCPKEKADPWFRLVERIWGGTGKGKHLEQQRWLNVCEI